MNANVTTALTILGIVAILTVYVAGVVFFRRQRTWLLYYIFGAFGLTLILVFGARWLGLAGRIESLVTYGTVWLAAHVGVASKWLGQSQFMVMDKSGWVVLETNIECSGLIETSILAGLIFFYPAFDLIKKIKYFSIGFIVTIIANTFRMLIIAAMTATFGRGAVFWGHAIVGRLFFFAVIIALYWFILTRPSIAEIAKTIGENRGLKGQKSLGKLLAGSITLALLAVMSFFILGDVLGTRQEAPTTAAGSSRTIARTQLADGSIQGIRADELTSAINVKDGQLVGTSEFKARLSSNETYLEFRYEGQLFSITTVPTGFKKVAGQAQREIITFKGVTAGVDVKQKLYVRRLKEEIKLLNRNATTTFRFTVSPSDNLILKKSGDYLAFFRRTDNKELVKIEQPYAIDKRGIKYPYRYELKGETLTLKPASSLADAVYPLVIDPSYTVVTGTNHDSATWPNNARKLARSSNGDLHCVYVRYPYYFEIFYAKSTNGGQTWTETLIAQDTTAGHQEYPSIAIDSSDNLHVVWAGSRVGWTYSQIWYKKCTGGTWDTNPTNVTSDTSYSQWNPSIAVDSSNNLHVVWQGYHSGSATYTQIRYKKCTGGTWDTNPTNVTSEASYDQIYPSIAVDSSDNLHVAWTGSHSGSPINWQIRYKKYTVGSGWDASPTNVTSDTSYQQEPPSIAVDSSDNLHVVWSGTHSGSTTYYQIRYKKYTVGSGWDASPTNLTSEASYAQWWPSIAVDSSDNLHVVWHGQHSGSTTYSQIRYKKYTAGGSWDASPTNLTSSTTADYRYSNLIWARWPNISGNLTNRPKAGYAFIYTVVATEVDYYSSSDLWWDGGAAPPSGNSLLSYGSTTAPSGQQWRTYTYGADWGAETAGPVASVTTNWTVLKASPTDVGAYVMAMVTTEAANNFKVYSYYNGVWTSEFLYTQSATQYAYRCFDVAFENSSGKVLVVYGKSTGAATQVYYREGTWNSGTLRYDWTSESSFTFNTSYLSGSLRWLVLANKLNYDEMILTAVSGSGTGNNISAAIWGGAGFGTQNAVGWGLAGWLSATAPINWDFDCAYETSSGDGMVAWGFYGTPYWKYVAYQSGAWQAVQSGNTSGITGAIRVLDLDADPTSTSNLIAAGLCEDSTSDDANGGVWNGAGTWTMTSIDTTMYSTVTGRQIAVRYAGTTGNAILLYDDAATAELDWSHSVGGAAFGAPTQWATALLGGQDNNIQLVADASSDKIMYVRLDSNSDLYAYLYTDSTTTWATTNGAAALEIASSGGTTKESYMFAFESVFKVPTLGLVLTVIAVAFFIGIVLRRKTLRLRRAEA